MMRARDLVVAAVAALALLVQPAFGSAQQDVELAGRDRVVDLQATELYNVGSMDGADWEVFASVSEVAFDADGNLFVLDGGNQRVVVLGPDGGHVRTIGRRGGGPGEFLSPAAMAVTAGGELVVYDRGRRAYSVFEADGTFRENLPTDIVRDGGMPGTNLQAHPRNGFAVDFISMDVDTGDPATSRQDGGHVPIQWRSLEQGAAPQEIFRVDRIGPRPSMVARPGEMSVQIGGRMPAFTPTLNWGVLPSGGAAFFQTTEYAVTVVGPTGEVERVLRRPIEPRGVAGRDEDDERDRRWADFDAGGGPQIRMVENDRELDTSAERRRIFEQMMAQLEFAEVIPVLANMAVDRAGRLWIQRTGRRVTEEGPVDIATADGEYLGTLEGITLPDAFGPGGRVVFVETDELGVPKVSVKRWQIQG
ncbi:6-bladed beta-propeller [Gemmatimonadota bacterium]